MISQSRWENLVSLVVGTMLIHNSKLDNPVTDTELDLIANVLKNNTPFQVVPDFVAGVNLEKNSVALNTNNVLLETQYFSVIDNGEMNV